MRLKLKDGFALSDGDLTHDSQSCQNTQPFKARPFKKSIFEKADELP